MSFLIAFVGRTFQSKLYSLCVARSKKAALRFDISKSSQRNSLLSNFSFSAGNSNFVFIISILSILDFEITFDVRRIELNVYPSMSIIKK